MTDEIENQGGLPESTPNAEQQAQEEILPEYNMDDLPAPLREGFQKLGWSALMPVQARAIPYILAHRDVMIQSRTGSGKTGAYLVPVFQRINPEQNTTQAMVLAPTRELAQQVVREAEVLGSTMNVRTTAVYGGVGYREQLEGFRKGAHLVVGTPGRILDHLLRRSMNLDSLKILIFDEADRMLSMGFYPDMKRVQRYLPNNRPLNSYMFSATFPPQVLGLAREFMVKPDFLNLSSDHVHVTETEHVVYTVPPMDKERSLIRIIEVENPASAIIFCNTKERVHFVAVILQRYGYNAAEISSDLSQAAREDVMERIRLGQLRFMVATDVASRGIDIPDLSHVFLYEVPEEMESYIHRAGRTGRAGASGIAISLVNALERAELTRIGKRYSIDFQERPLPSEEDVQDLVIQRTLALLEARLRERDRLQTERMQRFITFLNELNDESEGEAGGKSGLAMLLDDFYHEAFHTSQMPQPEGKPLVSTPSSYGQGGGGQKQQRSERRPGGGRSGDRSSSNRSYSDRGPSDRSSSGRSSSGLSSSDRNSSDRSSSDRSLADRNSSDRSSTDRGGNRKEVVRYTRPKMDSSPESEEESAPGEQAAPGNQPADNQQPGNARRRRRRGGGGGRPSGTEGSPTVS
jgi:ATP-dependent RNA helicase DeaD